jgi:hypothetical protein
MKSTSILPSRKRIFLFIGIAIFLTFHSSFAISGTPHIVYGKVFNSNGATPIGGNLEAYAYIFGSPDEILDINSVGCGYAFLTDGGWLWFEVGNYPTPWSINESLKIIVVDQGRGETGAIDLVLDSAGSQFFSDLTLQPGDNVGPIAYECKVNGVNPASIPEGKTSITLTARLDDTFCGRSNIQIAEYFIDTDPGFGLGTTMAPKDGSFNGPLEEITASVNSSSWKQGSTYNIHARGQDSAGNWGTTHMVVVSVTKPEKIRGDLDGDGDVDNDDLNTLLSYRNKPASVCPDCDLDGDGMITALDARKLVLLCTRPRCATQ